MKFLFRNRDNEIRTDRRREAGTPGTGTATPFGIQINALKPLVPWIH